MPRSNRDPLTEAVRARGEDGRVPAPCKRLRGCFEEVRLDSVLSTRLLSLWSIPALALLMAAPASGTVIAQGGFGVESSGCNGFTVPTTVSDPSFAQTAGSHTTGNWQGRWDVATTPSLVTADVRASAGPGGGNTWTCIPAAGTVNATDLTFSSVGGSESTIHVRFSLGFTSEWSGSNQYYRGVLLHAVLGSFFTGGTPSTMISRPPDDLGSASTCYTSPWITVPVDVAQFVQYTMYAGTQAGGDNGGFAAALSTMSAGCSGGDFIEIQEPGFSVDSAELGLVGGAFVVPEPASLALLLVGLFGLGAAGARR